MLLVGKIALSSISCSDIWKKNCIKLVFQLLRSARSSSMIMINIVENEPLRAGSGSAVGWPSAELDGIERGGASWRPWARCPRHFFPDILEPPKYNVVLPISSFLLPCFSMKMAICSMVAIRKYPPRHFGSHPMDSFVFIITRLLPASGIWLK